MLEVFVAVDLLCRSTTADSTQRSPQRHTGSLLTVLSLMLRGNCSVTWVIVHLNCSVGRNSVLKCRNVNYTKAVRWADEGPGGRIGGGVRPQVVLAGPWTRRPCPRRSERSSEVSSLPPSETVIFQRHVFMGSAVFGVFHFLLRPAARQKLCVVSVSKQKLPAVRRAVRATSAPLCPSPGAGFALRLASRRPLSQGFSSSRLSLKALCYSIS